MTPRTRALGLVGWVLLSLSAGWLGALVTDPGWYQELRRPAWSPPSWLFGPVWTVLYVLMGVAAWLVWKDRGLRGAPVALGLFLFQLALNAAWSPVFFGLRALYGGLVLIFVLWLAILATLVALGRLRPLAGVLLLPYLLWVTFATGLNLELWRLNA